MAQEIADGLIEKVRKGSERMSEAKAIALVGELYTRGHFKQAANVCQQIIKRKPTLAEPLRRNV